MTKKRVGGYAFRQEIARARLANSRARAAVRRMVEEQPGPQLTALLAAKMANALGEILDALDEIERICRENE